jgi:hypothetical protein
MRFHVIALSLALAAAAVAPTDPEWEKFKKKFKKTYKDADDEAARHSLFKRSQARTAELNRLNGHNAFGLTWTSDRYEAEKHQKGYVRPKDFVPTAPVAEFGARRNPASINWRYTEAVTAIKNQGKRHQAMSQPAPILAPRSHASYAPRRPRVSRHQANVAVAGRSVRRRPSSRSSSSAPAASWRSICLRSRSRAALRPPAPTAARAATEASPRVPTSISSPWRGSPTPSTSRTSSR